MGINLTKILLKYKKGWLALSSDNKRLVASGPTLDNVLRKARAKGVNNPSLLKAAPWRNLFVG